MPPSKKRANLPALGEDAPDTKKANKDAMGAASKTAAAREGFVIEEDDRCLLGIVPIAFPGSAQPCDGMEADASEPIPDVAVIQVFDYEELAVLRLELRQAIDHMPEFKAPTNLFNTKGVLQDSLYDDDEQLLVGGGFGALANPGSFHNHFVRRLRRKVQEHLLKDDVDAFGLDGEFSEHKGMLIEQVIDRMMVRKPGSEPQAESWHRDVARGTCQGDKVYGGWLNLDPPLSAEPKKEDYQYFSCVPKSASDPDANKNAGFAKDAPSPERIAAESHKVRIPPGALLIFNELTLHEVLKTSSKRKMSRVFFGWRLSKPEHHFLAERHAPADDEALRVHFDQMMATVADPDATNEQIAQWHSQFNPMRYRYSMIPDLLTRFRQQEGMPLKSGQHPERKNTLTAQHGPFRLPANHDSQNRYQQPNMEHYRTSGTAPGQVQENRNFETYPCGPPNWPHLWVSTNDPRYGILKFSYGAIERVTVRSEDGSQVAEGRSGVLGMNYAKTKFLENWNKIRYCTKDTRTGAFTEHDMVDNAHIWADYMPMLELRWPATAAKLSNRWPDGVVGVPQTFHGLKDYELMQKDDDGGGPVLDGRSADGRRSAYVGYAMSEVMLHFPLTMREAKYYLGMGDKGPDIYRYHKAKPFVWEPVAYLAAFDNLSGSGTMEAPPKGARYVSLPPVSTHLQQYLHARGGELRPLEQIMRNRDAAVRTDDAEYPKELKEYQPFQQIRGDNHDPAAPGSLQA